MPSEIVIHARPSGLSTDVVDLTESIKGAEDMALEAKAANTRRAYAAAWRVFTLWCTTKNLHPGGPISHHVTGAQMNLAAEPGTLVLYIYEMVSGLVPGSRRKNNPNPGPIARRPSTVEGHLAAIDYYHTKLGLESRVRHPRVVEEMQAAQRRHLGDVVVKKDPVLSEMLPKLIATTPDTPTGIRDRALILFSFGGAFRRDDVTSTIRWQDIVEEPEGLRVWLVKSKTDQTGKGRHVLILRGTRPETCAVAALGQWRASMQRMHLPVTGKSPVFVSLSNNCWGKALNGGKVALVVKKLAEAAGFDPKKFAGHSLRSGWITSALEAGIPMDEVRKQPGHKNSATTDGYDHRKQSWKNAPGKGLM